MSLFTSSHVPFPYGNPESWADLKSSVAEFLMLLIGSREAFTIRQSQHKNKATAWLESNQEQARLLKRVEKGLPCPSICSYFVSLLHYIHFQVI